MNSSIGRSLALAILLWLLTPLTSDGSESERDVHLAAINSITSGTWCMEPVSGLFGLEQPELIELKEALDYYSDHPPIPDPIPLIVKVERCPATLIVAAPYLVRHRDSLTTEARRRIALLRCENRWTKTWQAYLDIRIFHRDVDGHARFFEETLVFALSPESLAGPDRGQNGYEYYFFPFVDPLAEMVIEDRLPRLRALAFTLESEYVDGSAAEALGTLFNSWALADFDDFIREMHRHLPDRESWDLLEGLKYVSLDAEAFSKKYRHRLDETETPHRAELEFLLIENRRSPYEH